MKTEYKLVSEYKSLLPLIGVDMNVAMPIFSKFVDFKIRGYNKDFGGFPEELIAFILDMRRPTNIKGPDFNELGDCKGVKAKFITKEELNKDQKQLLLSLNVDLISCVTTLRNYGNPPVASFEPNINFFETNLWNKIRKIIFVYHVNGIIEDIRIFDGEKYKDVLNNDYELIKNNKNSETKILTLKKVTGSIQIKKTLDIFLSESIIDSNCETNEIANQIEYIENLFINKLNIYKDNCKDCNPKFENIERFIITGKNTPEQLMRIIELANIKLSESKIPEFVELDF